MVSVGDTTARLDFPSSHFINTRNIPTLHGEFVLRSFIWVVQGSGEYCSTMLLAARESARQRMLYSPPIAACVAKGEWDSESVVVKSDVYEIGIHKCTSWAPLCVNIVGEKFLFTNHFGKCNFTPIIGGLVCVF